MLKPLNGIKIIEIEGLGPAPFCGYFLAELGAEITLIKRPNGSELRQGGLMEEGKVVHSLDLKSEEGRAELHSLVKQSDGLIEGMRPGVMERLRLGPQDLALLNPALVYGRVTGWGQDGPLAQSAGHDLNYVALSGALWYSGQAGQPPVTPPTLVGDIAGGSLYLIIGLLSAFIHAQKTGEGQIIDAAMVDGSAHMMNLFHSIPEGLRNEERGKSIIDGPHWYNSYACKDEKFISIGALEPQFYTLFLKTIGLDNDPEFANQMDMETWSKLKDRLTGIFKTKTQAQWCAIMEGTDICFAPVLSPEESANHPHMKSRGVYSREDGQFKAARAPRFSPLRKN